MIALGDHPVVAADDAAAVIARVTGAAAPTPLARVVPALVAGLHRALAHPALGADRAGDRHVATDLDVAVEARGPLRTRVAIVAGGPLGRAHGVRVDVDVLDADDAVVATSGHVVQVTRLAADLPPLDAPRSGGPGDPLEPPDATVTVGPGDVGAYVAATHDGSPVHATTAEPVVPGLMLAALVAHRAPGAEPVTAVRARFVRPVVAPARVGIGVGVAGADGWAPVRAEVDGRPVLRGAGLRRGWPLRNGIS